MKTILLLLFLLIVFTAKLYSQNDPCTPQCNVSFDDVFRMRCPTDEEVAKLNNLTVSSYSFNPDKVTLGGPLCGDKVVALLNKFRDEDVKREKELKGKYCNAQIGWMNVKDCEHGGPPPCCPHPLSDGIWKKIDPSEAIQMYKAEQNKIYQERLKEIVDVVKPCKIQTMNTTTEDVDRSYNAAIQILNSYKEEFPSEAANVENTHGARIKQLNNQYQAEVNKGSDADIQKLMRYSKSMKNEEDALNQLSDNAEKEKQEKQIADNKRKEEEAKSKRTNANESAKTSKTESTTTTSTYVESDYARQMRLRTKAQQKKNQSEDEITATGQAALIGAGMAIASSAANDYNDDDYPVAIRGIIGANYQSIPVVSNYNGNGFNHQSQTSTTDPYCFTIGVDARFLSNKFIGININPFFNYGLLAFSSNTGSMMNYGGNANIKLGHSFQFTLKGAYEVRQGDDSYDASEIGIDGTTYSKYNYNTYKYGVGLKYKDIEIAALKENLSFIKNPNKNIFSFEVNMESSWMRFFAKYSPNYPAAGKIQYPNAYDQSDKQSLLQLGFCFRFSIVKSK